VTNGITSSSIRSYRRSPIAHVASRSEQLCKCLVKWRW
jgi:hypothetical protein